MNTERDRQKHKHTYVNTYTYSVLKAILKSNKNFFYKWFSGSYTGNGIITGRF